MQTTAKIFSGTGSQYLAEKISRQFGTEFGKITIQHFSDGEIARYASEVAGHKRDPYSLIEQILGGAVKV